MRCPGVRIPAPSARHVNVALQSVLEQLDEQRARVDPRDVELIELVQRGSSGSVHRGRYRGADVAVKQLNISRTASGEVGTLTTQQLRELEVIKGLGHPGILKIIGTCPAPEAYIVSPWCAAGDLGAALMRNGAPSSKTALALGACIADALAFLHDRNIVHRDLKPANVLLMGPLDEADRLQTPCVLGDFGTARPAADSGAMTGAVGTPAYSAPEVLSGDCLYGKPADVFSLGIMFWELLSGSRPHADLLGRAMPIMLRVVQGGRPAVDPSWPEAYQHFLSSCWHGEPSQRPEACTARNMFRVWREAEDTVKDGVADAISKMQVTVCSGEDTEEKVTQAVSAIVRTCIEIYSTSNSFAALWPLQGNRALFRKIRMENSIHKSRS